MKFLMAANLLPYGSDVCLSLRNALIGLGHSVDMLPTNERLSPREGALARAGLRWSTEYYMALSDRLLRTIRVSRPDILLIYGSNWGILPDALRRVKRGGVKIALWEGNLALWRGFQVESLRFYDHIFALDSCLVSLLRGPAYLKNVWHLLPGCDPELHHETVLEEEEKTSLGSDVCFIGSAHENRIRLFEKLGEFDLKLWGRGWEQSEILRSRFNDEAVYGMKKTKIYNASKIVVHLQGARYQIDGVSCRPFEVLACGTLCVAERKKDLAACLRDGVEIVMFESAQELRDKIGYYLDNESERKKLAAAGRNRVLTGHTYKQVAERMLEKLC